MTKNETRPKDFTVQRATNIKFVSVLPTPKFEFTKFMLPSPSATRELFLSKEVKAEIYIYLLILFFTSTRRRCEKQNPIEMKSKKDAIS